MMQCNSSPIFSSKQDVWSHICTLIGEQHTWCATTRPTPSYGLTPSFLGTFAAVARFASLPELKVASTVCLSPGPWRREMRDLVLGEDMQVRLLEPVSGLLGRYQELVKVGAGDVVCVGMVESEKVSLDILVVGSMGVDINGYRVGKEGDLTGIDYILGELGKRECLVVTLVHDRQVLENIPVDILTKHDLPVDIIVTPTRVIRVEKVDKPIDISWGLLKHDFVNKVPLLRERMTMDMREGKVVKLRSSRRNNEDGKMMGESHISAWPLVENDVELKPSKMKRNQMNMTSKFRFDNISTCVGYPEFKEALRAKGILPGFCVITLRSGSAVVAFKEDTGEVLFKLKDLEIRKSRVKLEEVALEDKARQNVKNELLEKRKKIEKMRSKVLQETFDKLREKNMSGVFIGKLPAGVTEADITKAFEAHNQVPITVDLGHRDRFAIAFFIEELQVVLSNLKNILINGKECIVEEYKPKEDQKKVSEASTSRKFGPKSPVIQHQDTSNIFNAFGAPELALFGPPITRF